jgi:HSP20 family protein
LEGIMHFDFEMALPGVAKDNIKIVVDNQNVLTISTESKNEQMDDKKGDWKRREFSYQAFSRNLPLPANVDLIHITAAYENGVLKIHLPKISGPSAEVVQKIAVS